MKKQEKLDLTKEKLVETTMRLMEECANGSQVTSRAIAQAAGVQLAMINYCFGSREALLYEAFCRRESEFIEHPKLRRILSSDLAPKEKLRELHYLIGEFLVKEYKFTAAITGYVLLHRDLTKGLNSLLLVVEHYQGRKALQECKLISYELSSMMQLAIYRYKELGEFSGYDFTDRDQLHRFVDLQIDLLLRDEA